MQGGRRRGSLGESLESSTDGRPEETWLNRGIHRMKRCSTIFLQFLMFPECGVGFGKRPASYVAVAATL